MKPGGHYIFTVPFSLDREKTIVRAIRKADGTILHYHQPEYHGDPFRGDGGVFTWRNYGVDILNMLKELGFLPDVHQIPLKELESPMPIIVAQKPNKIVIRNNKEEN